MKLDDATLRREYLVTGLGTTKLSRKYGVAKHRIALRLRKMGIQSNLHQNGRRVWNGMKEKPPPASEISDPDEIRREAIRKILLQLHSCQICGKMTISEISCFRHRPSILSNR